MVRHVVCAFALTAIIVFLAACSETAVAPTQSLFSDTTSVDPDHYKRVPLIGQVDLPYDHQSHPEYQLEWWYLTSVMQDNQGNRYPFQFTLFRVGLTQSDTSLWHDNQLWIGHASLHTPRGHFFEERFARGMVGNASVKPNPFEAYIDDWQWTAQRQQLTPSTLDLQFNQGPKLRLQIDNSGPYIKHQHSGVSIKSSDGEVRSFYYSAPFLSLTGDIQFSEKQTTVNGQGWFDHEWSTELVDNHVSGWDWFSLHLDNGEKLMVFRLHSTHGEPHINGTFISANGEQIQLDKHNIQLQINKTERIDGRKHPVEWHISMPSKRLDIDVKPLYPKQYNEGVLGYYEGGIEVSGSHSGYGFLELTGYATP